MTNLSIALLICGLGIILVDAQLCKPDWRFFNNKCYKLFNESKKWPESELTCRLHGGHHVSIQNIEENNFLSELAKEATQGDKLQVIWLGAAQFASSKDYQWSDLTNFNFEHWNNDIRPTYNPYKKCSKLDGTTGKWMQSCCKVPAAFVCQLDSNFNQYEQVNEFLSDNNEKINKKNDYNDFRRLRASRST